MRIKYSMRLFQTTPSITGYTGVLICACFLNLGNERHIKKAAVIYILLPVP